MKCILTAFMSTSVAQETSIQVEPNCAHHYCVTENVPQILEGVGGGEDTECVDSDLTSSPQWNGDIWLCNLLIRASCGECSSTEFLIANTHYDVKLNGCEEFRLLGCNTLCLMKISRRFEGTFQQNMQLYLSRYEFS